MSKIKMKVKMTRWSRNILKGKAKEIAHKPMKDKYFSATSKLYLKKFWIFGGETSWSPACKWNYGRKNKEIGWKRFSSQNLLSYRYVADEKSEHPRHLFFPMFFHSSENWKGFPPG